MILLLKKSFSMASTNETWNMIKLKRTINHIWQKIEGLHGKVMDHPRQATFNGPSSKQKLDALGMDIKSGGPMRGLGPFLGACTQRPGRGEDQQIKPRIHKEASAVLTCPFPTLRLKYSYLIQLVQSFCSYLHCKYFLDAHVLVLAHRHHGQSHRCSLLPRTSSGASLYHSVVCNTER